MRLRTSALRSGNPGCRTHPGWRLLNQRRALAGARQRSRAGSLPRLRAFGATAPLTALWALLLCALPAWPATKVFLHDAASQLSPGPDFLYKLADATQGTAKVTAVTNSIAGNVTGQYWPSSTNGHIITKTAGGTRIVWFSAPISSSVTISGSITPNLWGLESAIQCNCGARYEVLRWDVSAGGIVKSLGISSDGGLSEWGTGAAARTAPTLTPSSTTFNAGDRIVIVIYNDDGNGVTEGSGRNWTLDYDAGTAVDGDTYLSFTETITFNADSNNAPAQGYSAAAQSRQKPAVAARGASLDGCGSLDCARSNFGLQTADFGFQPASRISKSAIR